MSQEVHQSFGVGLDSSQYNSSLANIEKSTRESTSRTARMFSSIDRSANQASMRMGQVALQAADVAVQLESGAGFARVLAQQGSQIASIFGPGGMILGAVIAVGAGIASWVSNMKDANEEAKRMMTSLGELQKLQMGKRDQAAEDRKNAKLARMSGRTEIEELRMKYDEDIRKMDEDFENIPAHKRDWRLHEIAKAERKDLFEAEKDKVYTQRAEEFEKKEAADTKKAKEDKEKQISDLQRFEKDQYDDYQKYRESKLREFEQMQEREIKRVSDFERKEAEKNEKLASLRGDLSKEQRKAAVDKSAARGQSILDGIENRKNGISEADIRKSAIRSANEISRAVDREMAKEGVGQGLAGKEREEARAARRTQIMANINAAQNKDKLKAEIDGDSIKRLTDAIEKLLAK